MKKKQPTPLGARLLIKLDTITIGGHEVSVPTASEIATVLAVGDTWDLKEEPVKVGDRIHVKSWSIDIVSVGEDSYAYVWQKTGGVCGKI